MRSRSHVIVANFVKGATIMQNHFALFIDDGSGATAIEYARLASLIAVAIIGAATTLGTNIGNSLSNASSKL